MDLSELIRHGDMFDLRSSLMGDVRKLSRDADKAEGIVKKLAGLADDAMFSPDSVKNLSEEAQRLVRNTNAIYRSGKTVFETTFSYKIAKRLAAKPETAAKLLYTKDYKKIHNLKLALKQTAKGTVHPEGVRVWNSLRQQFLADIIEKSTTGTELNLKLSATKFDRLIRGLGKKSTAEIFEPGEITRISKVTKLLDATQTRARLGEGAALFSKSLQIGGVTMAYFAGREGDMIGVTAGGTLAISPIAFALLAVHPRWSKVLIAGFKPRMSRPAIGAFAARLTRALRDIRKSEAKMDEARARKLTMMLRPKPKAPSLKEQRGFGGRGF